MIQYFFLMSSGILDMCIAIYSGVGRIVLRYMLWMFSVQYFAPGEEMMWLLFIFLLLMFYPCMFLLKHFISCYSFFLQRNDGHPLRKEQDLLSFGIFFLSKGCIVLVSLILLPVFINQLNLLETPCLYFFSIEGYFN